MKLRSAADANIAQQQMAQMQQAQGHPVQQGQDMRMTEAQVGSEIARPCHLKLIVVSSVVARHKRWRWRKRSSKDGTMEVPQMRDTKVEV